MANLIMKKDGEKGGVFNDGDMVSGGAGEQTLLIFSDGVGKAKNIVVDTTIEKVDVQAKAADMKLTYNADTGYVDIMVGTTRVASVQPQRDTEGTQIATADGSFFLKMGTDADGNIVGTISSGLPGSTPTSFTSNYVPQTADIDVSQKSEIGGGVTPIPPTPTGNKLTTGFDTLTGEGTFDGSVFVSEFTGSVVNTLQTGDKITGTGTADVLNAQLGTSGVTTAPTLVNVETVNISAMADAVTFDMASVAGTKTLNVHSLSGNETTVSNLSKDVTLGMTGAGNLTLGATIPASAQIALSGGKVGSLNVGNASALYAIQSGGDAANVITLAASNTGTAASQNKITGNQSITLVDGTAAAANSVFTGDFIDASGLADGAEFTLSTGTRNMTGSGATTIDLSNVTGMDTFLVGATQTGSNALTLTGLQSDVTVQLNATTNTTHLVNNLVLTNTALTGVNDVLNLALTSDSGIKGTGVGGTVTAEGFEVVNILSQGGATAVFTGAFSNGAGTAQAPTKIVIDGASNQAVTFGNVTTSTLDASDFTHALKVTTTGSAMSIYGGSASDNITVGNFASTIDGGAGADTIDVSAAVTVVNKIYGGAGADKMTVAAGTTNTTFAFHGTGESTSSAMDVITGKLTEGTGVLKFAYDGHTLSVVTGTFAGSTVANGVMADASTFAAVSTAFGATADYKSVIFTDAANKIFLVINDSADTNDTVVDITGCVTTLGTDTLAATNGVLTFASNG